MDTAEENRQVYSKLRDLRRARGITVNELAKEMGENSQKVGRIERGKRSLTVDYLVKISKALGAPLDTFLTEEEDQAAKTHLHSDSNILNDVVVTVEDLCNLFSSEFTSQHKAKIISKIYEMALKVPEEHQPLFLSFLKESLKLFQEN